MVIHLVLIYFILCVLFFQHILSYYSYCNFAVFYFMEKSQLGNVNQTVVARLLVIFIK